ncbi:hypothetical protein ERJ75_000658600 [Trypanosoma vivax]|nr:hypothetical protein ERJ75_000658600 [Trypanosoma vivax]
MLGACYFFRWLAAAVVLCAAFAVGDGPSGLPTADAPQLCKAAGVLAAAARHANALAAEAAEAAVRAEARQARIAALKVALAGLLEIEAAKAAARERTSGGGGELVGKAGSGINTRRGTQAEERLEDEEINITLLLTQLASIRTAEGADARGLVHAMHAAVDAATRAAATRAATAHGSLASYIETLARTTDGTTTNWKSCLDNTKAKNSPSDVGTALSKSGDAAAKAILDAACPEGMLGSDLNLDNTLRDLAQLGTSIANSLATGQTATLAKDYSSGGGCPLLTAATTSARHAGIIMVDGDRKGTTFGTFLTISRTGTGKNGKMTFNKNAPLGEPGYDLAKLTATLQSTKELVRGESKCGTDSTGTCANNTKIDDTLANIEKKATAAATQLATGKTCPRTDTAREAKPPHTARAAPAATKQQDTADTLEQSNEAQKKDTALVSQMRRHLLILTAAATAGRK